jgi:hypothetical protein
VTVTGRLTDLAEALGSARSVEEVLGELERRIASDLGANASASLRREGDGLRCLASRGLARPIAGSRASDDDLEAFLGGVPVERVHLVRVVHDGSSARLVAEVRQGASRYGAVLFGRDEPIDRDAIEGVALAIGVAGLACAAVARSSEREPARGPSPSTALDRGSVHRPSEHWEAIGRITSTVLHELGNSVAIAALAASQVSRMSRAAATDATAAAHASSLADDLSLSVRQMTELLAELRRVSRGSEGARFIEPRAIVDGAARLAHAELRGTGSISSEVGELPLLSGSAGSLGAGFAYLFASVLRDQGGALAVRGRADGDVVELLVEGVDLETPRAADAVRILSRLARAADGTAELTDAGALSVRLPAAPPAAPLSTGESSAPSGLT